MRMIDPTGMLTTDYRNERGELLYSTDDGLNVTIIVPDENIPQLEAKLDEAHADGTINDPTTNQEEMHVLGMDILEYSKKYNMDCQYHDNGFSAGYEKSYNKESTFWITIFYVGLSSGKEGAQLRIGHDRGKKQGAKDREQGKINVTKPFESFKNNPPLLTIPKKPHVSTFPKSISIPK
jgi:hypothetical protein